MLLLLLLLLRRLRHIRHVSLGVWHHLCAALDNLQRSTRQQQGRVAKASRASRGSSCMLPHAHQAAAQPPLPAAQHA